ncbi:MAG: hypothetical protein ACRC5B_07190 [Fusobacteriaceae bacterium]
MKKIFILLLTLLVTVTSMAGTYHRPIGRPLPSHRPVIIHRPIHVHRPIYSHGHRHHHSRNDAAIAGIVIGAVAMAGIVAAANSNNNYYPRPVPTPYYVY